MDEVIKIAAENHANLIAARTWYDAIPTCLHNVLGDRMHENFSDWEASMLPDDIDDLMGEDFYFNRVEVDNNGKLFAVFLDHSTSAVEKNVEVVIE